MKLPRVGLIVDRAGSLSALWDGNVAPRDAGSPSRDRQSHSGIGFSRVRLDPEQQLRGRLAIGPRQPVRRRAPK